MDSKKDLIQCEQTLDEITKKVEYVCNEGIPISVSCCNIIQCVPFRLPRYD